jgi:hypothetical protein
MSKAETFIREHAWAGYLGGGTALISNMGITNWQWWAFIVPMIILVNIRPKR